VPELRRDPLLNRWVILAEERADRPISRVRPGRSATPADCPFCPGNERETLPEIDALRDAGSEADAPGWRIRVVPNKYPALRPDPGPAPSGIDLFARRPGFGHHEVIIEGEAHTLSVTELAPDRLREAFRVYRERFRALSRITGLESAVLIKNVGLAAGASIEHSHSQLIATPVAPPSLETELRITREWSERTGRCLTCAILAAERSARERIVWRGENLVAVCPWAPRFAYETWILPARCESRFEATADRTLDELAEAASRVLGAIETRLEHPPYNYVIHSAPFRFDSRATYHWRLAIMPLITQAAGYEQSTGLYINPVTPERAARDLRAALA
jgi:UDPglucose--hexose-1-phosphate uridylyltransferase